MNIIVPKKPQARDAKMTLAEQIQGWLDIAKEERAAL
jgi:hypothetical protein